MEKYRCGICFREFMDKEEFIAHCKEHAQYINSILKPINEQLERLIIGAMQEVSSKVRGEYKNDN